MYYLGCDELLERAINYQAVFKGEETINDAIVYIREYYFPTITSW